MGELFLKIDCVSSYSSLTSGESYVSTTGIGRNQYFSLGGGLRGLLETEKPRKKSPKLSKLQKISSTTENRNKSPHFGGRQNLSLLHFCTS